MSAYLIAYGSNVGDSRAIFRKVIERLGNESENQVLAVSQPVWTRPVGGPETQAPFLNAAIHLNSSLSFLEFHQMLIRLEEAFGRKRDIRWGPRSIDLDLLLNDANIFRSPSLTIPHPRMSFRRFVLAPATEIAADWFHPVAGMTLAGLLHRLDSRRRRIVWVAEGDDIADTVDEITKKLNQFPVASETSGEQTTQKPAASQFATNSWQFEVVSSLPDFDRLSSTARLVVWNSSRPAGFENVRFVGPQLDLADVQAADSLKSLDESAHLIATVTEILAAIQAMA